MTPAEIITACDRATVLFSKLRYERRGEPAQFRLIIETQHRVEQCGLVLDLFRQAELDRESREQALNEIFRDDVGARVREFDKLHGVIRLHAETFYFFAHRVWKLCKRIPGLSFEPIGVRDVRNWMIEHSDGKDGLPVFSWTFDIAEGLVLGPWTNAGGGRLDKGLYPNAQEFIEKLLGKLESIIPSNP